MMKLIIEDSKGTQQEIKTTLALILPRIQDLSAFFDAVHSVCKSFDRKEPQKLDPDHFKNIIETLYGRMKEGEDRSIARFDRLGSDISTITMRQKPRDIGKITEKNYRDLLVKQFPTYTITLTNANYCGDLFLRGEALDVLIEIKNYADNVPIREVQKFRKDMISANKSGIFLSHSSGIAKIADWTLETISVEDKSPLVAVYLHNVNFDGFKIRSALTLLKAYEKVISNTPEKHKSFTFTEEQLSKFKNTLDFNNKLRTSMKSDLLNAKQSIDDSLKSLDSFLYLEMAELLRIALEDIPEPKAKRFRSQT